MTSKSISQWLFVAWDWIESLSSCWEERCSWYRACLHGVDTGMRGARFDDQIGGEGVLDGALTREPASSCSPRDGASKGSDDEFSVGTMEVMGNELGGVLSGEERHATTAWSETAPPAMCDLHQHECRRWASSALPLDRHHTRRERPGLGTRGRAAQARGPGQRKRLSLSPAFPPPRQPKACTALGRAEPRRALSLFPTAG